MLDKFFSGLEKEQQNAVLHALAVLEDFQFFDAVLREQLESLSNSVTPDADPKSIHHRIIGFQAQQSLLYQLKQAAPSGE